MIWQIVTAPTYLTVTVNSLHCVLGERRSCKTMFYYGLSMEIITYKNTQLYAHKPRKIGLGLGWFSF